MVTVLPCCIHVLHAPGSAKIKHPVIFLADLGKNRLNIGVIY